MPTQSIKWQAQFLMAKDVVPDLSFHAATIGATGCRIGKPMLPAKERQAQTFGSGLPILFMDVPLLTAEFPEVWIEPEPCVASTGEESQTLCRDLSLLHVILFVFCGSPAPY